MKQTTRPNHRNSRTIGRAERAGGSSLRAGGASARFVAVVLMREAQKVIHAPEAIAGLALQFLVNRAQQLGQFLLLGSLSVLSMPTHGSDGKPASI